MTPTKLLIGQILVVLAIITLSIASAPREERTMTGLALLLQSNALRIALQPFRHFRHAAREPLRALAVAIALHRLPCLPQPLPVADKAVGALRGIDAPFSLELHGADCALAATIGGLTGQRGLALQGAG